MCVPGKRRDYMRFLERRIARNKKETGSYICMYVDCMCLILITHALCILNKLISTKEMWFI